MKTEGSFGVTSQGWETYWQLILAFPLSSIHSEEHFQESQKVMDHLLAKEVLDEGEEMYLDALSDLVSVYEDEHHGIEPASDADMLRHLLEARGITQAQLSGDAGISKSTISEILAGKKPFSKQILRKLADYFRIDVSVLTGNL